ncbi:flavin-containing monooxygenase [Halomonas cerina]|uniref:Cation diffusion facilitator CzcD-associated flavoprotein CzcO n=1 Tax=Halomonas cerina TaxID=447424 RepID=A0A839V6D4_9GAMM|nr:FAD-dependent oxidoreductase [Halomonas cerina]MBB3190982.1 cation diffusion facilitator CzcD-associated flavoprotein CzcO [Halomonas cerina]
MSDRGAACIIGAGVAGLVSAKVLKQDGFRVTIFEKETTLGGVWARSRAYPGLGTNNPRETYVFSDFPYPKGTAEFPSAQEVRDYLEAYVDRFQLRSDLCLATEVLSVSRRDLDEDSRGRFRVEACRVGGSTNPEGHHFDFVVVCNGVLSWPYIPSFPGSERFSGSIIHSSQTPDREALKDQRVVVIGAGKSAMDCAAVAAHNALSCTLVFRRPYWMLPRYLSGKRIDRRIFNRVTEILTFPAFHTLSRPERVFRWIGRPLAPVLWLFWRLQCRVVAREAGISAEMVPDAPIHRYIYHQGIGTELYECVQQGLVSIRRAGVDAFVDSETLRLDTGEEIAGDTVICATGWRRDVKFLEPELQREVCPTGHFRLYRHILPPGEPCMGFIGYASSGNAPLTSEISAHWLSQYFQGQLELPNRNEMDRDIDRVLEWTAKVFPDQPEAHFIGGYIAHYTDWLLRDMGLRTHRAESVFSEYLGPFWAERYRNIAEERRNKGPGQNKT